MKLDLNDSEAFPWLTRDRKIKLIVTATAFVAIAAVKSVIGDHANGVDTSSGQSYVRMGGFICGDSESALRQAKLGSRPSHIFSGCEQIGRNLPANYEYSVDSMSSGSAARVRTEHGEFWVPEGDLVR